MASPDDYRRAAGFRNSKAQAEAQDPAPLRQASPSTDAAKPQPGMFSRAYDAWSVDAAWRDAIAILDDSVLQREGAHDLKLYDALMDDDAVKTALDQRFLAVTEKPWTVTPGDENDPRSVKAADDLRAMLEGVGWDRVTRLMLFAKWYGYSVAEALIELRQHDGRTIYWLTDIVIPDRKWFAFTNAGELRMKSPGEANGKPVPPNKFWTWRTGGSHDFAHYGVGLAHWCYWPVYFKRNGIQFWAQYLEKFGQPTAVVPFIPGASDDDVQKALDVGKAIGQDSAVAVPANQLGGVTGGEWLKPFLMEAERGGSGAESYDTFREAMNDAIRTLIAGQVATSSRMATGLGSGQSDLQGDTADQQAKADSDDLCESFNSTFPVYLTRWNHGDDVKPPKVFRNFDEAEDLDTIAQRDKVLDELGWQRKDDSFADTYGDGYERKPEPTPPPALPGAPGARPGAPIAANDDERDQRAAVFAAGDPRPLYVSRKLLPASGRALLAWARGAGFTGLEDLDELHVTICYSRKPVDWFDLPTYTWGNDDDGGLTIRKGGPRQVEQFGGEAIVLMVASDALSWRASDLKEAGASYDHDPYRPHVTFAKGEQTVDLATLTAFDGELRFGPEIWEPLDTDPLPADFPTFSAAELDQVDRLTVELRDDLDPDVSAFGAAIADRVAAFQANGAVLTREGLRLAMLQALEGSTAVDAIARKLALPFAAERAAAAIGAEDQVTGA